MIIKIFQTIAVNVKLSLNHSLHTAVKTDNKITVYSNVLQKTVSNYGCYLFTC